MENIENETQNRTENPPVAPNGRLDNAATHRTPGTSVVWAEDLQDPGEAEDLNLWGPFIARGSVALWSGRAGVGKSTLAYNLAVHAAKGQPFGGLSFPTSPLRTLLVDLETPSGLRRPKLENIASGSVPSGIAFWSEQPPLSEMSLESTINDCGFGLVIIDTVSRAIPVRDEDDNAEATRQMAMLKNVAAATDAAIVAIHHLGKGDSDQNVYSARGASARPAAADIVVAITDHPKLRDVKTLRLDKSRFTLDQVLHLQQSGEDRYELAEGLEGCCASKTESAKQAILERLEEFGPSGLALKEILARVAHESSEGTVRRALDDLVKVGKIKRLTRGVYCAAAYAPSASSAQDPDPPHDEQSEQIEDGDRGDE